MEFITWFADRPKDIDQFLNAQKKYGTVTIVGYSAVTGENYGASGLWITVKVEKTDEKSNK